VQPLIPRVPGDNVASLTPQMGLVEQPAMIRLPYPGRVRSARRPGDP
jgi:hypothetical protein